jgi:small subunit ribosomal protein S2
MRTITLEELLEAGSHFGHQVTRQNPKAREYIFEARDGIHIIDLGKTKEGLEKAAQFIKSIASKNGTIIIVGTKRQAQDVVREEAKRAVDAGADGVYFVTSRWIGGTLTNFSEVLKNYKKLKDITKMLATPEDREKYTKRELGLFEKERQKLEGFYGGIYNMTKKPDALIVVDTHSEHLAVREGIAENVPVVGMVDTNADPLIIDHPIPANDDALGSIKLVINYLMDAWIEGKKSGESKTQNSEKKEKKVETKTEEVKSEQTNPKSEKEADEKASEDKKITESDVVAKESTAEEVATQTKKKAANTKKVTGTSSNS